MSRALAEMMPAVTVFSSPNGEPIAITHSPTRILSDAPIVTCGRLAPSILTSATSEFFVGADDLGLEFALVGQRHIHFVGRFDHMRIGHHIAVGRNDKAGADAARHFFLMIFRDLFFAAIRLAGLIRLLRSRHTEEAAQEFLHFLVVAARHALVRPLLDALRGADIHHRRASLFHQIGKIGQGRYGCVRLRRRASLHRHE